MSAVRQHLPGEREMYIEARFGGLEVIVGDEHGDILSADMTGTCVCVICYTYMYMYMFAHTYMFVMSCDT